MSADATILEGKKKMSVEGKLRSWNKIRIQGNKIKRALNVFSGYADRLS